MKTYLLKTSLLSVLIMALIPLAYAIRGRAPVETNRIKRVQEQIRNLETTNAELASFLKNYWKQGEQAPATTTQPGNRFLTVTTENSVNQLEVVEAVLNLSKKSGFMNSTIEAVTHFMDNPHNVRIAQELVNMSEAHQGVYSQHSVAQSVKYVANIKSTEPSQGVSTGSVLRAVGKHLSKVVHWGSQPKATYRAFVSTYNQAIAKGDSKSRALNVAIAKAFGLKGRDVVRKKQEILQYCRV